MTIFNIIMAEGYREFIYFKRYSFERISSTVMLIFIFLGFVYSSADMVNGTTNFDKISIAHKVVGFLVWFFALDAVGHLSGAIREDMHIGILEQIALSPVPLIFNMFGRSISRFIINMLLASVIFFIMVFFFDLQIKITFLATAIFFLTYIGLYGLGLFFAGLTLVFKRLGPVTTITRFFLLIFTGAIIPLTVFPPVLRSFSEFIPMTTGLAIMKSIIFDGKGLNEFTSNKQIYYFLFNTVVYFFVGVKVFCIFEKIARSRGALGTY